MEEFKFISDTMLTNYYKRWSMLNVKILLTEHSIQNNTHEPNEIILRKYLNTLYNNKAEEKKLLTP